MSPESHGKRNGRRRPKANGFPAGILVDRQIRRAREQRLIEIDPYDDRFLEPATYDLRVGDHAAVTTAPAPIDLRKDNLLTIEPGAMAILESLEALRLSDRVAARIGPKSSLLRRGIMVATGPQVDPGFHGRLIVNLINLSPRTFALRHQDPFLSMEFHALSEAPERTYAGEYQGRVGLTPEELELLFAYQGPTLAEIYRGFTSMRDHIREIARISPEFAGLRETIEALPRTLGEALRRVPAAPPSTLPALTLYIEDFGPEPYEAVRRMEVAIRAEQSAFVASFFPANVHASGDTDQEAFDNLRTLILDTVDLLTETPEASLSEELRRQRATLFQYVRRRAGDR